MNIVLAGMPASGKTTVSRRLGELLGAKVIDTDERIVEKYGVINDIFEKYGEEYFRDLETQVVKEVSALENVVVSTGGGCLLRQENRSLFSQSGKIVYLRTRYETLLKRVEGDSSRPLLKGGAAERLKNLLKTRTPVYESAADFTVDTDDRSPDEIARTICKLIKGA